MPVATPPLTENALAEESGLATDALQPDPFPLPLTPFERMMLAEDRAEYPMVATVEFDFSGRLDRTVLNDAYATAIARHPLLRARVEKQPFKQPIWVAAATAQVEYSNEEAGFPLKRIDLSELSGLLLRVSEVADRVKLQLHVHHACCDGSGIFSFFQDLLLAYHQQVAGETPQLTPLDFDALPRRNKFPLSSKSIGQWLYRIGFGIREAAKFTLRAIEPLVSSNDRGKGISGFHQVALQTEGELLKGLRKTAVREGVTLNDLLLRDYLATLGDWQRHNRDSTLAKERFRLLVPCDLRTEQHAELPAANVLGYAFLTRDIADCEHSDELLQNVQAEMAFIRETNASLYFLRCLNVAARVPGGMAGIGRSRGCFSTSLLSNLGDPSKYLSRELPRDRGRIKAGDLVLE
ncbi:MAG: hypothetical protein RID07_01165, partial [Lacipirellulaceae bacterium]